MRFCTDMQEEARNLGGDRRRTSGDGVPRLNAALLARRKALGLTQLQLADLAGVSARFIHELENGKETVRLDRVVALATALGLELGWRRIPPSSAPGDRP